MKAILDKLGIQPVNPGACTGPDSWIEDPDGKRARSHTIPPPVNRWHQWCRYHHQPASKS